MTMWDRRPTTLAARGSAVHPRHLGAGGGLIDEHQPFGIKIGLALEPGQATGLYVRPLLFGGVRRLFLRVIRCRSKNRCTTLTEGR